MTLVIILGQEYVKIFCPKYITRIPLWVVRHSSCVRASGDLSASLYLEDSSHARLNVKRMATRDAQ